MLAEEIDQQHQLLAIHRRTLAHSLRQHKALGVLAPPALTNGIHDAWTSIAQIKAVLRASGADVTDEPDDEPRELTITVPRLSPTERRNRSRMLQKVRDFWITGVLENSLHGAALIELGMEYKPDAVRHPWDMLIQQPDQPRRIITPGTKIIDVFDELGGELLILGPPGSGKTTMLLELTRDLISRAQHDETYPLPVVFNLASWAEQRQSISAWLVEELNARYAVPNGIAKSFIEQDAILLLLDGLDEVAAEHRVAVIQAINVFRLEHGMINMVVCSRTADYAIITTKLRLQGAVLIQPLTWPQIDAYLVDAGAQLTGLRAALKSDTTLRELVDSPLMLGIVTLAYQDAPTQALTQENTLEAQRAHIFATYVDRMFLRRHPMISYPRVQTVCWLVWLARHMEQRSQSIFYIERLQSGWLSSAFQQRMLRFGVAFCNELAGTLIGLAVGLISGAVFGGHAGGLWTGFAMAMVLGLAGALGGGLVAGLSSYFAQNRPVEILQWSWITLGGGRYSSLLGALGCALLSGFSRMFFLPDSTLLLNILFGGLFGLLPGWVIGWLAGEVVDGRFTRTTLTQNSVIHRYIGLTISGAIVGGLLSGWFNGGDWRQTSTLLGMLLGAVWGAFLHGFIDHVPTLTVSVASLRQAAGNALLYGLLFGLSSGLSIGIVGSLVGGYIGTFLGWFGYWTLPTPRTQQSNRHDTYSYWLSKEEWGFGLAGGLSFGLIGGPGNGFAGAFVGLLIGIVAGSLKGWMGEAHAHIHSYSLDRSMRQLVRTTIGPGLIIGILFGILFGLIFGPMAGALGALYGVSGVMLSNWISNRIAQRQPPWFLKVLWRIGELLVAFGLLVIVVGVVDAGLSLGIGGGLIGGVFGTLLGWLSRWHNRRNNYARVSVNNQGLYRVSQHVIIFGLVAGTIAGLMRGLFTGLLFGLIAGTAGGLVSGFVGSEIQTRTGTNEGIRRAVRSAILGAFAFALISGVSTGAVIGIYGIGFALVFGLVGGIQYGGHTALQHLVLRLLLFRQGAIPWNYARFLDHCTERIFLHKVGGGYIFVHRLLMEYFASLDGSTEIAEKTE
jgi:hypothetical protein